MGRFGSPIAVILFAFTLLAAVIMITYWCFVLFRTSRELGRAGNNPRAELLQGVLRHTIIWLAGTLAFTAVLWLAVCHDLTDPAAHRATHLLPSGPRLP